MGYYKTKEIIGWYNAEIERFLCDECAMKDTDKLEGYGLVTEGELEGGEYLYICDECGARFR